MRRDRVIHRSRQLIDATTGAHLWADRFDGSPEDVFELQDQVATSVAGVIEPALQAAEARRSKQEYFADGMVEEIIIALSRPSDCDRIVTTGAQPLAR